jgi:hypothetical protein
MALPFSRPEGGYRFKGGMKTNCAPDRCPPDKQLLILNGRYFLEDELRCRPGAKLLFGTNSDHPISNIASYSEGQGNIRFLAASNGAIYKDDSATPLDSSFNPAAIQSMVPYRPNQSPAPYVYVGDNQSYRKFSFPNASDVVTDQKVGIAEPQTPIDACVSEGYLLGMSDSGSLLTYNWDGAGGGASHSGITSNDTVIAVFQDPVYAALPNTVQPYQLEYILTLTPTVVGGTYPGSGTYERGKFVTVGQPSMYQGSGPDAPWQFMVRDVYPPFTGTLNIESIYYYAGSTGRCVIVPANTGSSARYGESLYSEQILANLRRGSIVQIDSEQCFVDSVTVGPDGTICFEVTTTSTHTTSSTITGVYAIKVLFRTYTGFTVPSGAPTYQYTPQPGDTIYGHFFEGDCGNGINTATSSALSPANPFNLNGVGLQDDDYIHIGVWCADLTRLTEIKLLIDVDIAGAGAGTAFTQNFYYYTIRPADYVNAIANTLTQLGAAQLTSQRAVIDEEAKRDHLTLSSAQQTPGSGAWAQIFFRLKDMNRVGSDQTRTLMNANSYQVLFNCNANVDCGFHTVDVFGGFSPEVTSQGGDMKYRIRPRSSVTGAKGNPSPAMRYGVRPQRQQVTVVLPTTYSDPQVDTWDIFRDGGTLTAETFVGFVSLGTGYFQDDFADLAIVKSQQLDFDNLEPWPTIDNPFAGTAVVAGTTAVITPSGTASTLIANYLPGNKVQIGQFVYTLWTRPTSLGGATWLFQFQENASSFPTGNATRIYEPLVANQQSRMTWGPTDEGGVVFGLDSLRTGTLLYSKNFDPDSVPDRNTLELCPPSEFLMGGAFFRGLNVVGSTARKWKLIPSFSSANKWTPQPLPGGGLASPFGLATDGNTVFSIEKDGIYAQGQSITAEDLSNIFPNDGVPPNNFNYRGVFRPPDFTKGNLFRLSCDGTYLYFDYIDLAGANTTLVYDIRRRAWSLDLSLLNIVVHVPVIQAQSQASGVTGSVNPVQLLLGDGVGNVYQQQDQTSDAGDAITFRVITAEEVKGDDRANAQWGDVYLSAIPSLNNAMTVTGCSGGADLSATVSATGSTRQSILLNTGNPILFSYGLDIVAVQTFAGGEKQAVLFIWQPAWIPQPVVEQQRAFDWDDAGILGNKFMQGFVLEANTFNISKTLGVRDSDLLALHPFTPNPVAFNGQSEQAFSFNTPFVAHSVRMEPQDAVNWNFWKLRWVAVPYPEAAALYSTEGQTHGMDGFMQVFQINLAYISIQPVTVTLTTDQGPSPSVTFPATAAQIAPAKILEKLPFNKFKIVSYSLSSSVAFYCWRDMCETWVKQWGDTGPFRRLKLFGGNTGGGAEV